MINRLRGLGIVLGIIGLAFVVAGGFAFMKVQEGQASLKAFSAAQGVELSYNEDGQLVDGGEVEGAQGIMAMLTDDWGYPVVTSELDPADPVVNTGSEYMYQMATVSYHTLHGTQTVILDEDYHGSRRHRVHRRYPVRDRRCRPLLGRLRPIEPDRRGGPRTGLDRRGPCPHRRARCRHRHLLCSPARPRTGRTDRRVGRNVPPHRRWPGVGNPAREGRGPGAANGELDRLRLTD